MFVRTESGEMAPVGQFITLIKVYGAETLTRFNMYTSIPVNGMPADGYSSGDAIAAIEEVASQTLPTGAMSSAVLPEKNQAVREIR